jgi:hypothetical protein
MVRSHHCIIILSTYKIDGWICGCTAKVSQSESLLDREYSGLYTTLYTVGGSSRLPLILEVHSRERIVLLVGMDGLLTFAHPLGVEVS